MKRFALASILIGIAFAVAYAGNLCVAPPPPPPPSNPAAQIAADMQGHNEGHPHGVPSTWDFYSGPFTQMGNNPAGNSAIEMWGAVYVDASGNPATNTRVNIRGCQAWWLRASSGQWIKGADTSTPDVGSYAEDFSADYGAADVVSLPDGSISVTAGNGHMTHFYAPYPRIQIDPQDFGGVVSICQMRLVLADPNGPDDRGIARFLGEVGADYYPSTTGPGIQNNPGIAGGKFKYVQSGWRSFAMTTLSQSDLAANPPPINLTGVAP